jgi:hypothetical protein
MSRNLQKPLARPHPFPYFVDDDLRNVANAADCLAECLQTFRAILNASSDAESSFSGVRSDIRKLKQSLNPGGLSGYPPLPAILRPQPFGAVMARIRLLLEEIARWIGYDLETDSVPAWMEKRDIVETLREQVRLGVARRNPAEETIQGIEQGFWSPIAQGFPSDAVRELSQAAERLLKLVETSRNGDTNREDAASKELVPTHLAAKVVELLDERGEKPKVQPKRPKTAKKSTKTKSYTQPELDRAIAGYFKQNNDSFKHYLDRYEKASSEDRRRVTDEARKVFGRNHVARQLEANPTMVGNSREWRPSAVALGLTKDTDAARGVPTGSKVGLDIALEQAATKAGDITESEVQRRETIEYLNSVGKSIKDAERRDALSDVRSKFEMGDLPDEQARELADAIKKQDSDETHTIHSEVIS